MTRPPQMPLYQPFLLIMPQPTRKHKRHPYGDSDRTQDHISSFPSSPTAESSSSYTLPCRQKSPRKSFAERFETNQKTSEQVLGEPNTLIACTASDTA